MSDEQKKTKLSKEELEKLKKLTNLENPPVKQDTQPLLQTSQEKQIIDTIHKDITILENNNSSIPSKQQDVDSIKKEIQKHLEAIKSLQKTLEPKDNKQEEDIHSMLNELEKNTQKISPKETFIESFSFLSEEPEKKKIIFEEIKPKSSESSTIKKQPEPPHLEKFEIPDIEVVEVIPLKDTETHPKLDSVIEKTPSQQKNMRVPIFVENENGISMNPQIKEQIDQINKQKKKKAI